MKIAKHFLLVAATILFSYAPVLTGAVPRDSGEDLSLINKPDPILAGIEPLCVVVLHSNTDLKKGDLLWKNLQRKTESELKKAGIGVIAIPESNYPPEIPELRIAVDMMRHENSTRYFLHIQTSLARIVYIEKNGSVSIKTDVWKIGPAMEISSAENMQSMITRTVSKQVDVFINACMPSNPSHKPSEPNNANPSRKAAVNSKSDSTEYSYVASKDGKVFHKADCQLTAQIKPENLVGYNTRQNALDAGKKPCKVCRP